MKLNKYLYVITSFILAFSILNLSIPATVSGIAARSDNKADSDLEQRLSKIEEKFEKRRKELGIPGMSVAIVKDGKVLLSKGYGFKDFENKVPMTAETQLAIGSATKAFTALSVLMLKDEGKLSLDDHPRKHLPYFKINNPDTNKKIQVRDLLSHSSGLNRTDLAMIAGNLSREELIQVAGIAKPMAGLREKFYYQNLMFTAAGEIVSEVSGMPWEEFVPKNIFAQLGMNNSTMSVSQMQKAADYSFGYIHNFDTKETRKLPTRNIDTIAPAGSINSSSNDMAKWLLFSLSGGHIGNKQIISADSFDEWTKPQMKITPDGKASYGLGWFVQEWKAKKVIQHGGNIDGFNSMVAMMPEEKLGFVLLTNVSASSLGGEMMQIVWSGLLDDPKEGLAGPEEQKEVGKYNFPQAGFDIDVEIEDGKLVAKVPNQPTYVLVKVDGRKYALSNAPPGFFITFKEGEALLEQPNGKFTLKKHGAESTDSAPVDDSLSELLGEYRSTADSSRTVEIKKVDGKVSLVVGSQPPYPLKKNGKDVFGSTSLPETYYFKIIRGENSKIKGLTIVQPEGEFEFTYIGETEKNNSARVDFSASELVAKVIVALGGEDKIRKVTSRKAEFVLDAVHQGVKGYGKSYSKEPGMSYTETTLTALGKKIGWTKSYYDGKKGGTTYSFSEPEVVTGKRLRDVAFGYDFYPFLDLEDKIEKAEVGANSKIDGRDVYKLTLHPKDASRVVYYISADTFLPLKRFSVVVSSTSSVQIPVSESYSDYRKQDGVMIPFKLVSNSPTMGDIITTIRKIKTNVKIRDRIFTIK